jgi:hypothetical protein
MVVTRPSGFQVLAYWNNSPQTRHTCISPFRHIIQRSSPSLCAITSECCELKGEATNINFYIPWFDLRWAHEPLHHHGGLWQYNHSSKNIEWFRSRIIRHCYLHQTILITLNYKQFVKVVQTYVMFNVPSNVYIGNAILSSTFCISRATVHKWHFSGPLSALYTQVWLLSRVMGMDHRITDIRYTSHLYRVYKTFGE